MAERPEPEQYQSPVEVETPVPVQPEQFEPAIHQYQQYRQSRDLIQPASEESVEQPASHLSVEEEQYLAMRKPEPPAKSTLPFNVPSPEYAEIFGDEPVVDEAPAQAEAETVAEDETLELPEQYAQEMEELQERGQKRVVELRERGYEDARIYDPQETSVGGIHAFFVILGEPENYNFPPAPEVPTAYLKSAWSAALISAAVMFAIICIAFAL